MFLEDCNLKKGCSLCLKLQLGRINEICGQEASGKTNLALHIIKEAQIKSAEVQSSPKLWQRFRHMDEVLCGGNALKFYAVV
ncbi:uncharacterized protein LOC142611297 isoform X2 [Castanea sativa]|uniref:uncharacterized protein LOC142611297 isoform X2 n=1 Tax=Castanea sativa TaxID=21020 RepID=UPI003F64B1C4